MTFSFSRVHAYEQCPYQWYRRYLAEEDDEIGNYYADLGTAAHKALEEYFKGEIGQDDVLDRFIDEYHMLVDSSRYEIPSESGYYKCFDYFADFKTPWANGLNIIGVEQKYETEIGGYKYKGFVDLIQEDDDGVIITDHKSCKHFFKKDGGILKAAEQNYNDYKKQMYLYAYLVINCEHKKVTAMQWHHFKDGGVISRIPFKEDEYQQTLKWFTDTIDKIRADTEFVRNQEDWGFCNRLCDYRHTCQEGGSPCLTT